MAVVMNPPSMEKFEPLVKPGGYLIINDSLIPAPCARKDITAIRVPANDMAKEMGNERLANMVLLGALMKATGIVSFDSLVKALEENIPERRRHLLEPNVKAIERGAEVVEEVVSG
jgi:2-oxoglutarate ferredoxin oxidoreductase subunit gamma